MEEFYVALHREEKLGLAQKGKGREGWKLITKTTTSKMP